MASPPAPCRGSSRVVASMGCRHCKVDHQAGTRCPAEASNSGTPGASLEGQRHGPLVLRRRLGAGALGSVYLAEYPPTGHRFAVKVLHPNLASRPGVCARFYTEAHAARGLVHRHVARVLDARPGPGGLPALLMEYADGEPLSRLPMPLAPVEAVELLGQALGALEAAHARGLVHRELSADNLVLTRAEDGERRVKVLDFGASAVLTASLSEEERECGMVVGAPAFIAPEQWTGDVVDGRADLYAVGVVGYLLVTGRLPFGFGRVGELAPPQPHELNPYVPAALSAVLLRALAQRPEERFQDARAFREALERCLSPSTAAAPLPVSKPMEEPRLDIDMVVGDLCSAVAAPPAPAASLPEASVRVPWDFTPAPVHGPSPRPTPVPSVTIFGHDLTEAGATPLYLALKEAAQGMPTPPPVVEASAPRSPAPAGLSIRLGLGGGEALVPVEASDVALDGFFAAWDGALPPLAARTLATISYQEVDIRPSATTSSFIDRPTSNLPGWAARAAPAPATPRAPPARGGSRRRCSSAARAGGRRCRC